MRRLVTVLVVALAFGTAASAQAAMPVDQKLAVWQHVCAASGGTASFPEGVASCARTPAGWNPGAIRQFQNVCFDALGGAFYSYFGTPDVEVARCGLA